MTCRQCTESFATGALVARPGQPCAQQLRTECLPNQAGQQRSQNGAEEREGGVIGLGGVATSMGDLVWMSFLPTHLLSLLELVPHKELMQVQGDPMTVEGLKRR